MTGWTTQAYIEALSKTMIVCTTSILEAIAVLVERGQQDGLDVAGGEQVRKLIKDLPLAARFKP